MPQKKRKVVKKPAKKQKVTSIANEKTLRQVPLPVSVHHALKSYASDTESQLQEVYDNAILWFLEYKRLYADSLFYFASPTPSKSEGKSRYTSMWIDTEVLDMVKELAEEDGVPENRIIFTALVYFLKDIEYIP